MGKDDSINVTEQSVSSSAFNFDNGSVFDAKLELICDTRASVVNPTVRSIIELLAPFASPNGLSWIELALQEAMRNAYEHGNLGFSGDEKKALCEADSFDDAVKARENERSPQGKQIHVAVHIAPAEFSCSIEDEGNGFNWQEAMAAADSTKLPLEELRGRGLLLIAKVFDEVKFNAKGNKVTLKKRLPLA